VRQGESQQRQSVEEFETREITLERGQQLIVNTPHRKVFLTHKRSGLHVDERLDGRRVRKTLCVACNEKVYSAGCARIGCPVKVNCHGYSKR
jgi:hypothetical protein